MEKTMGKKTALLTESLIFLKYLIHSCSLIHQELLDTLLLISLYLLSQLQSIHVNYARHTPCFLIFFSPHCSE